MVFAGTEIPKVISTGLEPNFAFVWRVMLWADSGFTGPPHSGQKPSATRGKKSFR
ncbi:hypothetical protein D3C83_314470 [compost metagenome]